jgi:hypothetical protein
MIIIITPFMSGLSSKILYTVHQKLAFSKAISYTDYPHKYYY